MFLSYGPEPRCQEEIPVLVTLATLEKPARMPTLIDYFAVNSGARRERQDCSRFSALEPE